MESASKLIGVGCYRLGVAVAKERVAFGRRIKSLKIFG